MDILAIAMRYLHVAAAIVAVGGLTFVSLCLTPAVRLLEDNLRESVVGLATRRFTKVVWGCVAVLVVSGVYNWMILAGTYKAMGPIGNALIGTKVLLAFILFLVIWMQQSGFAPGLKPKAWLMIKLHLAAIVILLGTVLRHYRLEHLASLAGG